MFSAILALAFSVAVCIYLTIGFDGLLSRLRDAFASAPQRFREARESTREQLRAVGRTLRRRPTQES